MTKDRIVVEVLGDFRHVLAAPDGGVGIDHHYGVSLGSPPVADHGSQEAAKSAAR